jgi:hypothetical protein
MSSEIMYRIGDATLPVAPANSGEEQQANFIIVHICNDIGGWGRGFVLEAISKVEAKADIKLPLCG